MYTPQPGTIPYRVIEFLKQQPPGSEFSSAALAEAIGHEGASLSLYLLVARDCGAVKSEKRQPLTGGQRTHYWRLGEGERLPKPSKPQAVVASLNRAAFGWFTDGSLVIRQPGAADIQLSKEDTDDLVKFIRQQVRG